jgi:exosortase A
MKNSLTIPAQPAQLVHLMPIAIAILGVLLILHPTVESMVSIWMRSGTFAHAFLVPPIVIWMIWRQREKLATITSRPMPLALLAVAAMGMLWLLGELASMNSVTQFALVGMIVLSVPAVFGWSVTRELAFPLAFLFFAVPLGEFLVPAMMEATADFTVAAVQFSGVPVYREGLQFIIPSGAWSVIEACSGVRYLIASFMVGTLFAYLNYRSTRRRLVFVLMSLLVPIIANWLRAYMIVMLGHLSNNQLAVGVDHLIYGWVFFGVVIGIMFAIGARWSEPPEVLVQQSSFAMPIEGQLSSRARVWMSSAGVILIAITVQGWFMQLDRPHAERVGSLVLPESLGSLWHSAPAPLSPWTPAFRGATQTASRTYLAQGKTAAVWIGYYKEQSYDKKLVSYTNTLVDPNDGAWGAVSGNRVRVMVEGKNLELKSALVRNSSGVGGVVDHRLLVWHVYWVGGRFTSNDVEAKLLLALNRLLGGNEEAAVLMFYTPTSGSPSDDLGAAEVLRGLLGGELSRMGRLLSELKGAPATSP